jgi:hypothetical protein
MDHRIGARRRRHRTPQVVDLATSRPTVRAMARKRHGRWLGMPYDWRRPTRERLRRSVWDPREKRVLVPKAFGWGYDVNLAALWRRATGRRR